MITEKAGKAPLPFHKRMQQLQAAVADIERRGVEVSSVNLTLHGASLFVTGRPSGLTGIFRGRHQASTQMYTYQATVGGVRVIWNETPAQVRGF